MKRLLFLTYYFPPSGGPGVQRALKFAKYLPAFGWDVTVVTVDPAFAAYPDLDAGLVAEIPEGATVVRTKARDPYAAYARLMGVNRDQAVGVSFLNTRRPGIREKAARWIRANVFIPDARVGWIPFARRAAEAEATARPFNALLSTGPPHSTHLAALAVKKATNAPWILDLRDAWPPDSFAHLLPVGRLSRRRDEARRRAAFNAADLLTTVTDGLSDDLKPITRTRVEVVPNGFDPDDFRGVDPIQGDAFTIVYTGNLSAEQNPIALWHALKQARVRGATSGVRLRLVGHVAVEVLSAIEQAGLRNSVEIVPYVEHREAVRHMVGADLLLLCINRVPNPGGIVTGKLYEYLASGRPVLCLSPTEGEAARLIERLRAGRVYRYEDAAGVASEVARHVAAREAGERLPGAAAEAIGEYSRKRQAGRLAALLDALTSSSA